MIYRSFLACRPCPFSCLIFNRAASLIGRPRPKPGTILPAAAPPSLPRNNSFFPDRRPRPPILEKSTPPDKRDRLQTRLLSGSFYSLPLHKQRRPGCLFGRQSAAVLSSCLGCIEYVKSSAPLCPIFGRSCRNDVHPTKKDDRRQTTLTRRPCCLSAVPIDFNGDSLPIYS